MLAINNSIEELNLSRNCIRQRGAVALCKGLQVRSHTGKLQRVLFVAFAFPPKHSVLQTSRTARKFCYPAFFILAGGSRCVTRPSPARVGVVTRSVCPRSRSKVKVRVRVSVRTVMSCVNCLSVCLSVYALKGKRLQLLSTTKLCKDTRVEKARSKGRKVYLGLRWRGTARRHNCIFCPVDPVVDCLTTIADSQIRSTQDNPVVCGGVPCCSDHCENSLGSRQLGS